MLYRLIAAGVGFKLQVDRYNPQSIITLTWVRNRWHHRLCTCWYNRASQRSSCRIIHIQSRYRMTTNSQLSCITKRSLQSAVQESLHHSTEYKMVRHKKQTERWCQTYSKFNIVSKISMRGTSLKWQMKLSARWCQQLWQWLRFWSLN